MAYDDVIPLLGNFGRYQRRIYILLCLPTILCAFHKLGNVFLQAKPDHRCQLPDELSNATYVLSKEILNASFPWNPKSERYSSCTRWNGSLSSSSSIEISCDKYIYDYSKYESSAVIEWDLVCNKAYLRATADSIFMVGVMLGSIGFGELSDRYGRKLIFFISLVIQVFAGLLAAFAPEYWSYTIARSVVGATTSGVFLVAYVIAMEMVGPKDRMIAGTVCQIFFSTGFMLTALVAYLVTDWRNLQIALTIPGVVFFCYWWFIPESARWLILNNRIDEAKEIIQKAAKVNKKNIPNEQLDSLLHTDVKSIDPNEKRATVLDIFKHSNLRKKSLVIFFDWFANSITYYGLSWNTSNLGGNDYLNFVVSGAVEIPAQIFLLLTLNRWGRKLILCGSMVTAGVALLLTMAVPKDYSIIIVLLAMIGKLAITSSYGTIYIFSTEQFPTVVRNAGLGAGSTSARIGSIFAPIINLTSEYWTPLPLIIFGSLALIGGCLSLLLPETLNKQLPESIEDGENFGKKDKKKDVEKAVSKDEVEPLKSVKTENGITNGN